METKEIKWENNLLLLSIYLCCSIFLTSCDTGKELGVPEFEPDTSDLTPGDISDKLVARIYFDATLSMQGFVVPAPTDYTRICQDLDSVVLSSWKGGRSEFFWFGEKVESIDRSTYLQAVSAEFYENKHIYRKTFIEKIIAHETRLTNDQAGISSDSEESAEIAASKTPEALTEVATSTENVDEREKENSLVIILTDLFQDQGDIALLVRLLKEKYIQKGLEVGLFGLRSQFDGTVYNIGIGQKPLPHRSNPNDPDTFRPFYLLVLGRHADIAHFFTKLKSKNPEAKTILFSRYLVSPLLSFANAEISKKGNLNENTFHPIADPSLKQYEIVKNAYRATIPAELTYTPLPHAMSFDPQRLEPAIKAKDNSTGQTKENSGAAKCLKVESELTKEKLMVDFTLESSKLESAIYLYEVTLHPKIEAYREPEWCSAWDMGSGRDGSKTLNLVNFVQALSQVTVRTHHPKIATFHFYVKKR